MPVVKHGVACVPQGASAFGNREEVWSTLSLEVDPGSGATRHKIESVAQAGGVHRDARRREWHLARVPPGLCICTIDKHGLL